MKAKYPGTCGICFRKFKKGDEIARVPHQLLGPISPPYAHKACAYHANRVFKSETNSEVSDE